MAMVGHTVMNTPKTEWASDNAKEATWSDTKGLPVKPPTPIEEIARTLSEAREVSGRIRVIIDGLIGPRPESEGIGQDGRARNSGVITDLATNAESAFDELRRANDELSRLSKVLGLGL